MMVWPRAISPPPPIPCRPRARIQSPHARSQRAGERTGNEDPDPDEQDDAAAIGVRELAVEGRDRRRGQEVDRHDPGQMLEVAEIASDRGQRRRDDGLIERRQEHGQQDPDQDLQDLVMAHRTLRVGRGPLMTQRINGHSIHVGSILATP